MESKSTADTDNVFTYTIADACASTQADYIWPSNTAVTLNDLAYTFDGSTLEATSGFIQEYSRESGVFTNSKQGICPFTYRCEKKIDPS